MIIKATIAIQNSGPGCLSALQEFLDEPKALELQILDAVYDLACTYEGFDDESKIHWEVMVTVHPQE